MKIINELSSSAIKNNKKDTLATRFSILMAVILLGTIVFIMGSFKADDYNNIKSMIGDYHVSFSEIDEPIYDYLTTHKEINHVEFDKIIETGMNEVIYEKSPDYWNTQDFEIIQGKKPTKEGELIVPSRFLVKNNTYTIGSELKFGDRNYIIVGEYNDYGYGYSFEDSILFGYLENQTKENLLQNNAGVRAYLWYDSPRDTYTLTRQMLNEFQINESEAENSGRLSYNTGILEYKMIYPSGLIPPKSVVVDVIETYSLCFLLTILFAVMIYGAFNVWNSRDIKELALLKSVGMTEKQVKKMVRLKVLRLSVTPILAGTVISYGVANLLMYLVWLNNSISNKNLSDLFGAKMRAYDFHFIGISVSPIILIIILSLLTVYFSALIPSRKSAKLRIIEGLNGRKDKKNKYGASKIGGQIEISLARDYFKSYKSTYRTIILAMIISAMAITVTLVSQSYRALNMEYDQFNNPYHFTSDIFTSSKLEDEMISKINDVKGIDELHVYGYKDFNFLLEDNENFASEELSGAFTKGKKSSNNMYLRLYGLSDNDYQNILKENNLDNDIGYVLLNKTPKSNFVPYTFREYIPLTEKDDKNIVVGYDIEGKSANVPIGGFIDTFPYELDEHGDSGVYIFTAMNNLEKFNDEADPVNYYTIQFKANQDLARVSDESERIISSFIPESDYSISTTLLTEASDNEIIRNEHLLNAGIQIIFLIIALSNAYNSFHGNLRARKREFQLLTTVGMTEKQIKKMILSESRLLFTKTLIAYIAVFIVAVIARVYRSNYNFGFGLKELLANINYIPIILVFGITLLGMLLAIHSSIQTIFKDDLNDTIREI
ncbi:ABC transporter permease [Irregularibacter muris]|uniref:ABC transporter permease n=1 Tax=Irregularibacter muris TaxID=1796619 RepID=A0AAE3L2F7_9FIRM|nr:ABC transporter permease [Irregularibacter muris]MCR1898484.1 ABC transporter permease [Irregularibacter muris]